MAPFLEYLYRDKKFIKALESKLNIVEGALTPDDLFLIYTSYKDNIWDNFISETTNIFNESSMMFFRYMIYDLCNINITEPLRKKYGSEYINMEKLRYFAQLSVKDYMLKELTYDYATIQSIIDGAIKTPVNIFKDLLMSIGFVELNPDMHYNQKPPHSFIIRKLFMPHKATISKNGYVFTIEGGYTSFEIFQNDVQPKKCKYPGITQSLYVNFNSIQKIVEVFTNGGISEQSDKLLISVNLNDICKTYRNFCNQEMKSDSLLKLKDVLRICNFIEHHFYMKFSVTRDVADVDINNVHFHAYHLYILNTKNASVTNIYFMFDVLKDDLNKSLDSECFNIFATYFKLKSDGELSNIYRDKSY